MPLIVVFIFQINIYHKELKKDEEITIGSGKKDTIKVESLPPKQIIIEWKKKGIYVSSREPYYVKKQIFEPEKLISIGEKREMKLFIGAYTGEAKRRVKLPYNCLIKLGRNEKGCSDNNIGLQKKYVSRKHLVIKSEAGVVRVEDLNSKNGTYLNGKNISQAKMQSGDVLSVLAIRIKFLNGELIFENIGEDLQINKIPDDLAAYNVSMANGLQIPIYHCSPRIQKEFPTNAITLAAPPPRRTYGRRGILASLVGQSAMVASTMAMGVVSPAYMIARAAGMIPTIVNINNQAGEDKRQKKLQQMRQEYYGQYIQAQKVRIETVANEQREILTEENPSPNECMETVRKVDRKLWERDCRDRDFLDVRLGMGYEPLCVEVKSFQREGSFQMETDEAQQMAEEIIEQTRIVDYVPARLKLLKYNTVGVIGDRKRVVNEVRNLIINLSTTHFYKDVKIVGIFDEDEKAEWYPIRWLPHVWDDEQQSRFLAFNKSEVHTLCEKMNDMLVTRINSLSERQDNKGTIIHPQYLFILGSRKYMAEELLLNNLLQNRPELGVSTLFLFDEMHYLNKECQYIVDLNHDPCAYEKDKINKKIYFTMDDSVSIDDFDIFTRNMAAIQLEETTEKARVPDGVTFLQGYRIRDVDELDVISRWKNSKPYETLAAPIGVLAGNKVFALNIHENDTSGHGPHGLVAGTTGSGKSELLLTWILSMAVNYHPHDVNFVLIDYKGGGMASQVKDLPHVVGTITNIGNSIRRSLISLQSETERREKLFTQCDEKYGIKIKDIYDYQRYYKKGMISEPLPHLVIVVDEFAELKKEQPDFMKQLKQVARVGRSLGIHLVLATQKPSGVVDDQIWSNSRFKLCLKVQDSADSREMLKRPDAARITRAGRAYVLVDNGQLYELFQSFWSGAPYSWGIRDTQDALNRVRIVTADGMRLKTVAEEKTRRQSDTDELHAIVKYIVKITQKEGIKKLNGPWLPELPEFLPLSFMERRVGYQKDGRWEGSESWLRIPIGMYDNPSIQSQGIQYLNLAKTGHTGIYGAPSTGKTTLLKTVLMSVGLNYTPEQVQVYVIDCGGGSLSMFTEMPHVGGVALREDSEKVSKLETMLWQEVEYRKKEFLQNHVGSLEAYRDMIGKRIPAWILMIDNLAAMFAAYPDLENTMVTLTESWAKYGIYLIYTANNLAGVKYKMQQSMKYAIAFELSDKSDYTNLVGSVYGVALPQNAGRALVKDEVPLIFQVAFYADGENELQCNKALHKILHQMNSNWRGNRPKAIPIMPESIEMSDIQNAYLERERIPLGIRFSDIKISYVDMLERYIFIVSGMVRSGKSKYLGRIADMVHNKFADSMIYIFDGQGGGLKNSEQYASGYCKYDQSEDMDDILAEIVGNLEKRNNLHNQEVLEQPSSFDASASNRSDAQICIFIDDIKEFTDIVKNEQRDMMERICRKAQGLGVVVFAAGCITDINKAYEFEPLTRMLVSYKQGMLLSGSVSMCYFFENDLKYAEKSMEIGEGEAYLMDNGTCTKIKLAGD